jgi:DeoR/GlpR family transcriptional regulator of sugar metabolism
MTDDPDTRSEGAPERRAWITSTLRSAGFLAIADIARELGVSVMTVRRDLHSLEAVGEVRLVHGGVTLTPSGMHGRAFLDDGNSAARARVASRAAGLVGGSDTVAVDAGPTAYAVAMALPGDFRGSVITHSLPVLHLLDERTPAARTVALGGELLADRHAFVGPTTEAAVDALRARTFFFSPAAVDVRGTYSRSPGEASVQRRLIGIADEVVLVVTHEVFANSAPACVAALAGLTVVVTDRPLPRPVSAALHRAHVPVHAVDA